MAPTTTETTPLLHPLDPLSAVEVERAWEIVRAERTLGARIRVIFIMLHEPAKKVVLAHIEKLAAEMGAAEPEVLAHQLALLIDGAIVAAMVSRNPGVADTAGLAACSLFGPAKVKRPKRAASSATAQLVAV